MRRHAFLLALLAMGCDDPAPRAEPTTPATEAPAREEATPEVLEPTRALAYQPGSSETDVLIGRALEVIRAHPPGHEPYVGLAVLFVRRARETQDPEIYRLADDAVKAALSRAPTDSAALSLRAHILQQDHRFREARDVGEQILTARPDDVTGHIVYGDALLELGDYEQALGAYQRALTLRPDLRSYNRGAYMRWLNGEVDGSLELLAMALDSGSAHDPEALAWCHADHAEIEWLRGNFAASRGAANSALELVPDYVPALRIKSRVLAAEGDLEGAIRLVRDAIHTRPLMEDLLQLAEWLERSGGAEEAQQLLTRAEAMRREDQRSLAVYYARHDTHRDEAVQMAERELRDRPSIHSHDAMALTLLRAGRIPEARREIDLANALHTPDPRFALHEALIENAEHDREGALAAFARANAMNAKVDPILAAELARILGVEADHGAPAPAAAHAGTTAATLSARADGVIR